MAPPSQELEPPANPGRFILDLSRHVPFYILHGASGIGKTSLLRAGVYATLLAQEQKLTIGFVKEGWLRARNKLIATRTREKSLIIATAFDPAETSFDSVCRCFTALVSDDISNPTEFSRDIDKLKAEIIARFPRSSAGGKGYAKAAILIDAFERFYDYGSEVARNSLLEVAFSARVNVLVTIRSSGLQFLDNDEALRGKAKLIQVREIDPERFPQIIAEPALRCAWRVSDDLKNLLSAYFRNHSHSLPLIARVMQAVWQARERSPTLGTRTLTSELLREFAGCSGDDTKNPIDCLIENICSELDNDIKELIGAPLDNLLFRMCRIDEASGDIRSVGCRVKNAPLEKQLVELLCSAKYRLFTRETKDDYSIDVVRPTHDRVLTIWRRAKDAIDALRPELLLHSRIDKEYRPLAARGSSLAGWLAGLPEPERFVINDFFSRWLESLEPDLQRAWRELHDGEKERNEAVARTQRLLNDIGAHRASTAGILAELLNERDPAQAVLVALAAPDPSPKGKPYKSIVTALMRGLHELRELACFSVNKNGGPGYNSWLFDGTWDDDSRVLSAFQKGRRLSWRVDGESQSVEIIPKNHSAVLTLTDGGWGCVFTAKDVSARVISDTAVFIHHTKMSQPIRFNFGPKHITAGALFDGSDSITIAVSWEQESDGAINNRRQFVGLCRLRKAELLVPQGTGVRDFPATADDHDWSEFEVKAMAWAGAGPRLFVGGRLHGGKGSVETRGQVWETAVSNGGLVLSGVPREVRSGLGKSITRAALSRDGKLLLTGGSDGRARIHSLQRPDDEGRVLRAPDSRGAGDDRAHNGAITAIAISRDGAKAFTSSTDAAIRIWDTLTGEPLGNLVGHSLGVSALANSRDGRLLASVARDGTARLWDVWAKAPVGAEQILSNRPIFLSYTSEDQLVCASSDGNLVLFGSKRSTKHIYRFDFPLKSGCLISSSLDLGQIVCCVGEGAVGLVNLSSGIGTVLDLPSAVSHRRPIATSVCDSGAGSVLIGLDDGRILRLNTVTTDIVQWGEKLPTPVNSLTLLSTRQVLCGRTDQKPLLISLTDPNFGSGAEIMHKSGRSRTPCALELQSLGMVATAGSEGRTYTIHLWDRESLRSRYRLEGHTAPIECIAVLGDGRSIISGSRDCTVRYWDAVARIELCSISTFGDWVTRLAVSPSGDVFATGEAEREHPRIRQWGANPTHYQKVNWSSAIGDNYAGPAFEYAGDIMQQLRPDGLPDSTKRRFMLDRNGAD